ncbi:hypothetical protein A1D23_03025 [Chelonobacter oris]|uniref:type II secretion system protein GspD n=1 Tax=Chelonobacter oris TaxID=505317 RepID=UPI00244AD131|nr:type II secretion system protein GspD [Chelonobacter oris]MDH3001581.1 hypothetical protein [Chelonobacter oris]
MKFNIFFYLLIIAGTAIADTFKLDHTPLNKAIGIIYEEVLERPYMIDPNILEMNEKISFYLTDDVDKEMFFKRYFENMNVKVYAKNGVDYLKYVEPVKKNVGLSYVYKPKFRGVEYLSENIKDLVQSSATVNPKESFKGSINVSGDVLVVHADKATIAKVKNILPKIDTKPKQVIVTARLLEVKKAENSQSGLRVLADILNKKLALNFNLGGMADSVVSLKTHNVNALFSIFDTESRFNVISSPILRVMDSETGNFTVGSDVPTLGAETVQSSGVVTRDINYRSAGVIFDIKPIITDAGIKVKIRSELSDFTDTKTGVNDTPTLLKRLVDSTVYLNDGSLIILGGLSEEKNTRIDDSIFYLPSWIFGKTKKFEKSDILLLLHVKLVDDTDQTIDLDKAMTKQITDNLF